MKYENYVISKGTDLSQVTISVGATWFQVDESAGSSVTHSSEFAALTPLADIHGGLKNTSQAQNGPVEFSSAETTPHDTDSSHHPISRPRPIIGTRAFGAVSPYSPDTSYNQQHTSTLSLEEPILHFSDPRFAKLLGRSAACPPTEQDFRDWIRKEILLLIKQESADLIAAGLDKAVDHIVKEFGDAFIEAYNLEKLLQESNRQDPANSLDQHKLRILEIDAHLRDLDESERVITWAIAAITQSGLPGSATSLRVLLRTIKSVRDAAYALQRSHHFTYQFEFVTSQTSSTHERHDVPQMGDSLILQDGTLLVLFAPLNRANREHSKRDILTADALVITPDGIVREDSSFDLSEHKTCLVRRSGQPWATHDSFTKRRSLWGQDRWPLRAELVGKTGNGQEAWLFWKKNTPFRAQSPETTWAKRELGTRSEFRRFGAPQTLREALALQDFPEDIFCEPAQLANIEGSKSGVSPALEDTPAINGLETLTRLLQKVATPAYLHVSGTYLGTSPADLGFTDCHIRDGVIATTSSSTALEAALYRRTQEGLHHALPEVLASTLHSYPIVPILIVSEDSKTALHDIRTAVDYNWRVVVIAAKGTDAGALASSLEVIHPELIRHIIPDRSPGAPTKGQELVKRVHSAIEELIADTQKFWDVRANTPHHQEYWPSIIRVQTEPALHSTSELLIGFDSWAYAFQRELCEKLLPYAMESDGAFKEVAISLRVIQQTFSKIRRSLLPNTLYQSKSIEWSLEELETILAEVGVLEEIRQDDPSTLDSINEHHRRLSNLLSQVEDLQGLYALDDEISRKDLVRISELMEISRNRMNSATGTLHGMLYGDMSPERFKKFFERGSRIITCRDRKHGTIQLFMLYDPPRVCAKNKANTCEAFGKYTLAQAIATARDPRTKAAVERDAYQWLVRALYLHQIRDGVDFIFGRVHPRNIHALIPHQRAGLVLSCIADEVVDGQRFATMYVDLATLCDDPMTPSTFSLENAIARAWTIFAEEFPARQDSRQNGPKYLTLVRDLIRERLRVWNELDPLLQSPEVSLESILQYVEQKILAASPADILEIKPDRKRDLKDLIETTKRGANTKESVELLLEELELALLSRKILESHFTQAETLLNRLNNKT